MTKMTVYDSKTYDFPVFVLLLYSMCPFLFPGLGYIKHQNEGDYHLLFELRFHISYT